MSNWIHFNRLSFLCVAAAVLTVSSNASADYYAYLSNDYVGSGYADQGSYVQLYTDDLSVSPVTTQFVTHEMWYGVVDGGQYWVEVGVNYGEQRPSGYDYGAVFWADNRNGGGYHEHYPGTSWSFDTWQWVYVERTTSTSCSWYVFFSANRLDTSTNNCPGTGRRLVAGIEATTQGHSSTSGAWARGWLYAWERKDSSGTWYDGWNGVSLYQDSPPYIQYTDGTNTETEEVINVSF